VWIDFVAGGLVFGLFTREVACHLARSLAKIANPKSKNRALARTAGSTWRSGFRRALRDWFARAGRDLPWRRDPSPYAVVVSEFMLQQTQVATVIPYFTRWLARFPSFAALARATEEEVLSLWQGLGYYARARNLHRLAQEVVARFGGILPDDDEAIACLPGIGPYTAGAIASFAFDRPAPTVDGNIARVLARLIDFAEPIDTRAGQEKIWQTARDLLPPKNGREYTSALMELGALLCTPRAPQCLICPVREYCAARSPESLPVKKPRARITPMLEECGWCRRRGRILLEYQSGLRWRGLWKLPPIAAPDERRALFEAVYPFTKYRVTLRVFAIPPPATLAENQAWVPRSQIATLPLTAPHRRAIESLLEQTAAPHRTLRGFRSVEVV
jgi:A/G-specific adenine glycosylase